VRQLNYIQNKKLGFNKDQVILIDDVYALGNKQVAFKDELLKNSGMLSATISGYMPVAGTWRSDTPGGPKAKLPHRKIW
jgi:hypothetical protein